MKFFTDDDLEITMNEQEFSCYHYEFFGLKIVCTRNFVAAFEEDYPRVAMKALYMIAERYPEKNWDKLQTFESFGIDFWIISYVEQDADEATKKEGYVTVLLPEDY